MGVNEGVIRGYGAETKGFLAAVGKQMVLPEDLQKDHKGISCRAQTRTQGAHLPPRVPGVPCSC